MDVAVAITIAYDWAQHFAVADFGDLQVERLSGLIEMPSSEMLALNVRKTAIDSTASIDTRLRNLYQYIENDILGSIHSRLLEISPYKVRPYLLSLMPSGCTC